jgi:putative DNA primase/helicase
MTFQQFAASYGLNILNPEIGRWVRIPTTDKPHKKNGAYYFTGDFGVVQNWGTMDDAVQWRETDTEAKEVSAAVAQERQRVMDAAFEAKKQNQAKAAAKAAWMMKQSVIEVHPYLDRKGFVDETASVLFTDNGRFLLVPMYINKKIVGVQAIDEQGGKRFLFGQQTSYATFEIDAKGKPILCEGYATARSIRHCMKSIGARYRIIVCFSAGNLKKIARDNPTAFIVADHDASGTGQKVAEESGLKFYLPEYEGEDFNDEWLRLGKARAAMRLKSELLKAGYFK